MDDREGFTGKDRAEFDWMYRCCEREKKVYKVDYDDPLGQICDECKRELRNAKWEKILREAIC